MHIVQLISHYLPATRFGGPQHVAHGLGRALVASGHQISVCTTNLQDETRDLDVPVNEPVDLDGVSVTYCPTQWSRYWGYAPTMSRQAAQLISQADGVFAHFHYQYANFVGARLARKHRRPYLVFAHGSFKHHAIQRRSGLIKSAYLQIMERRNLSQAQAIIFNAEEERRGSRYSDSGVVIPNGIAPHDFANMPERGLLRKRLSLSDDDVLMLFFGRIDYEGKGLDLLLNAYAELRKESPQAKLVVAGPDERGGQAQLERHIAERNLERDVLLTGMLTGPDKLGALADADVFLLPSRSEGLSIALLEALFIGIPVLVTNTVGLHESVTKLSAGIVVEPVGQDILEGLRRLVPNTARQEMRGNATQWIRDKYTWAAISKQVLPLLERQP